MVLLVLLFIIYVCFPRTEEIYGRAVSRSHEKLVLNLIISKFKKQFQSCTMEGAQIKIISLKGMKRGQCVENCKVFACK